MAIQEVEVIRPTTLRFLPHLLNPLPQQHLQVFALLYLFFEMDD